MQAAPLWPGPGPASGDLACLDELRRREIPFVTVGPIRGVDTPLEITGPIGGIDLIPRAARPPLMDCALAGALADVAPFLREQGVSALSFSGAYDYRNVRGTSRLSGHAHGLAIDVHALETALGPVDVEGDWPRDPERWHATRGAGVEDCVGEPVSPAGRLVRTIACTLRGHAAFSLVLTPDDNDDHHNHLHLETARRIPPHMFTEARGAARDGS